MRCFFLRSGHIVSVQLLPGLSERDAIVKSHKLFAEAPKDRFDGFELWETTQFVMRYEQPQELQRQANGSGHHEKRVEDGS